MKYDINTRIQKVLSKHEGEVKNLSKVRELIAYNETHKQTEKDPYLIIAKYRKYAEKSDKIHFGNLCKETLPKDFKEWVIDGCKSFGEYSLTNDTEIDGDVINLTGIGKDYPYIRNAVREAIKSKSDYTSLSVRFRGATMTVYIYSHIDDDNEYIVDGEIVMEYFTGKRKHYTLICEESFIGTLVD